MGRECGYLALMAGIAGGADVVVIPEIETQAKDVAAEIRDMYDRGKSRAIVVAADGIGCGAAVLAQQLAAADIGFALRTTTLSTYSEPARQGRSIGCLARTMQADPTA